MITGVCSSGGRDVGSDAGMEGCTVSEIGAFAGPTPVGCVSPLSVSEVRVSGMRLSPGTGFEGGRGCSPCLTEDVVEYAEDAGWMISAGCS